MGVRLRGKHCVHDFFVCGTIICYSPLGTSRTLYVLEKKLLVDSQPPRPLGSTIYTNMVTSVEEMEPFL